MRLIHAGGFSRNERKQWRVVIFLNLTNAFQILLSAMDEQRGEFEDEENVVRATSSCSWSTIVNRWLAMCGSDRKGS
jgi:hypothetical protein